MSIRVALFDVGGVLNLGSEVARERLAEYFGLSTEVMRQIWQEYAVHMSVAAATEAQFWQSVAAANLLPVQPQVGLLEWAYQGAIQLNIEALQVAHDLRALGCRTAILSNTVPVHAAVMRAAGVYRDFDPVMLSCEIQLRKPDPACFQFAIDQLKVPPGQIVFIDNSQRNITVAEVMGFKTILFTPGTNLRRELGLP